MSISAQQCRAARGLFAMTQQELSAASGVGVRTIASFEDAGDRQPVAANLAAIRRALEELGVVFTAQGVAWSSPFSETQVRAVRALSVKNGNQMCTPEQLRGESGCSRPELDALTRLQIVEHVDTSPLLTAIGHHIPHLLRVEEDIRAAREALFAPLNYTVHLTDKSIFHARTASCFRIEDDGTLSPLLTHFVAEEDQRDLIAGAREALRQFRERDPRVVGNFVWR